MTDRRTFLLMGAATLALGGGLWTRMAPSRAAGAFPVTMTEDEWRRKLTPEQYSVLRESGTERPFTSALLEEHRAGTFICAGCDLDLFASSTKFDSGTGWPSFWTAIDKAVGEEEDNSLFMTRTSLHCNRCGGHLGHVFEDGPAPTGLRYCINGVALAFRADAA